MRWALAALALALASPASAAEQPMRILGEITAPEGGTTPRRFILDIVVWTTPDPQRRELNGWLAVLAPTPQGGGVTGHCDGERCAITSQIGYTNFVVQTALPATGELPRGAYAYTGVGEPQHEGEVRLTRLGREAPGLGTFTPPDSVGAVALSDLLDWNGFSQGFMNDVSEGPPGERERKGLSAWQTAQGRPAGGLILREDLKLLRAEAARARKALRWTPTAGKGWRGAYPAAWLRSDGSGARFVSEDGEARLSIHVDPPMSGDDWQAFTNAATEGDENRKVLTGTRIDDDMELTLQIADRISHVAYHRRPEGVATLTLSYPAARRADWTVAAAAIVRAFQAAP